MILITYTTEYREGGAELQRTARTMRDQMRRDGRAVRCERVESKREFVDALQAAGSTEAGIDELHFCGHSGMYGPMFGTQEFPEQFSPHEWRELEIPFSETGEAFFHACRTARWFAPFFARTFSVPTHGYHWYTTFSASPDRFIPPRWADGDELYLFGCPGKTSHGVVGALGKYTGWLEPEELKRFEPEDLEGADGTYDEVADLYDAVFDDIRVRVDEWRWLSDHMPDSAVEGKHSPAVLDIGCGNGALLDQLSPRISKGRGVDVSPEMLDLARERNAEYDHIEFSRVEGPNLPYEDASFDVVVSFLSFRYLDWDPILMELNRVLKSGGRFLVVDLVTKGLELSEVPDFVGSTLRVWWARRHFPEFKENLERLVDHPGWEEMLDHNPIRSEHEFKWYLESRFPDRGVEKINIGWKNRVLAFDSGPIDREEFASQSYP